jgi:hypothetical protein
VVGNAFEEDPAKMVEFIDWVNKYNNKGDAETNQDAFVDDY